MFYAILNKSLLWIEGPLWVFIKKYWKSIAILGAILYVIFSLRAISARNKEIADLKAAKNFSDSATTSKIKYWTDKYGSEHARAEDLVVAREVVEGEIDSSAKLLDIKPSQVVAINKTGIKIEVHEKLKVDTFWKKVPCDQNDSIQVVNKYDFHFKDAWLTVDGSVGNHEDTVNAIGYDTLKRVDYTKRAWLLGPTHHYSDFTNSNPHVKLMGYKGVEFTSNAKHWSFGPDLQVGYPLGGPFVLSKPQIFIGLSIQYSLIRF